MPGPQTLAGGSCSIPLGTAVLWVTVSGTVSWGPVGPALLELPSGPTVFLSHFPSLAVMLAVGT